ncbi:protein-disulfide reductase DsbD domain-containing protein [Flavivirga rizhaonensis]|uniref:Thiol:disulfide interchange protein DsbD N-terminal domain-containing protein n=1 Tax=Flavivirga rizhaonensis TaxID=2559571 RepID=A0A4S1DZF9_9FLAO|nr:protein-disulfide reductase DsbD domain-containing protein [Flavivirga rizhaonensis]TGV03610.1 hypothetical protein EM932_06175 [Flavivirga rizhaonensis]
MNILKQIVLYCSLLVCITATAQILEPAKWQCNLSKQNIKQGDIVELIFNIKLDTTWHLYSNIQNYKIGPLPTTFEFEPNGSYQLIGEVIPIDTKKEYDKVFEVHVNYFEHSAEFRQKVKILSVSPVIKGYYEYQVCSIVDGKCILGDDEFEFKINTNYK